MEIDADTINNTYENICKMTPYYLAATTAGITNPDELAKILAAWPEMVAFIKYCAGKTAWTKDGLLDAKDIEEAQALLEKAGVK